MICSRRGHKRLCVHTAAFVGVAAGNAACGNLNSQVLVGVLAMGGTSSIVKSPIPKNLILDSALIARSFGAIGKQACVAGARVNLGYRIAKRISGINFKGTSYLVVALL